MKKLIIFCFVIFSSLLITTSPAHALVIMQEKGMVTIGQSEIVDDDLFIGAESITIEGIVKGSIFAGAGSVTITGNISGDVIAGTGNLTLTGAQIGGNLIAGAGQVYLDDKSKIAGSLIVGAGSVQNSAQVGRNVMLGAGSAYQNSVVGKELRFGGGSLELGPQASITGDLTYALGEAEGTYKQAPEATIAGTVKKITPPVQDWEKTKADAGKAGMAARRGFLLFSYLGALLIGFLLVKFAPRSLEGFSKQINSSLSRSLGIGFFIVIFSLPTILVLTLTIIGLPLVGLLIPLLIIEFYLAKLISSYVLGQFIAKQFNWNKLGSYATLFVGLTAFYFLRAFPVAGWLISVLFTWAGLGAIWLYSRANLKKL